MVTGIRSCILPPSTRLSRFPACKPRAHSSPFSPLQPTPPDKFATQSPPVALIPLGHKHSALRRRPPSFRYSPKGPLLPSALSIHGKAARLLRGAAGGGGARAVAGAGAPQAGRHGPGRRAQLHRSGRRRRDAGAAHGGARSGAQRRRGRQRPPRCRAREEGRLGPLGARAVRAGPVLGGRAAQRHQDAPRRHGCAARAGPRLRQRATPAPQRQGHSHRKRFSRLVTLLLCVFLPFPPAHLFAPRSFAINCSTKCRCQGFHGCMYPSLLEFVAPVDCKKFVTSVTVR
jgi:hypothetical protein